jgi:hypothetical protein
MPTRQPARPPTRLFALVLLALAALACNTLLPTATALAPANDQLPAALVGTFDCVGYENGMLAGAGVLDIAASGDVEYEDFDGAVTTGQWSYAANAQTLTFTGIPLDTATPLAGEPGLAATVRPGTDLAHAETGLVTCTPSSR